MNAIQQQTGGKPFNFLNEYREQWQCECCGSWQSMDFGGVNSEQQACSWDCYKELTLEPAWNDEV